MKNKNFLLNVIAEYDARVANMDVLPTETYTIDSALEVSENVYLVTFTGHYDDCDNTSTAVFYDDEEEVFFLRDWQGAYPQSREEIEEYEWMTSDGRRAVVINGLPVVFL